MKKLNIIILLTLFVIAYLPSCSRDTGSDQVIDITPSNKILLPAEEGPVRSAFGTPVIDLNDFKLEITGLVDSSYSLTWNEIKELPKVSSNRILMYCVEGWEVWGNWEGIMVSDLIDNAFVQETGNYVLFSSVDGYTTSLPIAYLQKYNAILAYNVNGSPLKDSDGFPLRLIAFGKFGYKWAKWVNKLTIIDKSEIGFWESIGFSDQADVQMYRRYNYEGPSAKPLDY